MLEEKSLLENKNPNVSFLVEWVERIFGSLIGRPLVYVLLMCLFGSYLGFYASWPNCLLGLGILVILTIWISFRFRDQSKTILTLIFGFAAFLLNFSCFTNVCQRADALKEEENYEGMCVVCSRNGYLSGYKNLTLRLESGEEVCWLTDSEYRYGDQLSVRSKLSRISPKGNPGDTDYVGYYQRSGIFRSMKVEKIINVTESTPSWIDQGFRVGEKVRNACFALWEKYSDSMTSMFLSAMVVGDTSHLDESIKERFKDCNLFHLLVVSGAHVGYFTATIAAIFSLLSRKKKIRIAVMAVALIFFGFVIGWSSSATRSILTFMCVSLLSFEKRRIDRISACALSGLILRLCNPYSVFSQGLLLSFGATFSIMLFEKRITYALKRWISGIPEELIRAFSCYLCANIGMLPVLLAIGNTQSVLKLIVVLMAGFPAELICSLGLIFTAVAWFLPFDFLKTALFLPLRGLVSFLDALSSIGEKKGFLRFSWQNLSVVSIVMIVSFLLYLVCRNGLKKRTVVFVLSVSSMANVLEMTFSHSARMVNVYFLDVGQGDCALICCGKKSILVDGGNIGNGETILSVMEYFDIDRIDMALASHLDSDHIAGLVELYGAGRIDEFYSPFWGKSAEMTQLETAVSELPNQVNILKAGDEITLEEDIVFHVVWPKETTDGGNEDSMVIWAEIWGTSILFTGDIGEATENSLIDQIPEKIDILKVPHHGSRFSVSDDFYNSKKIGAAVISVGYNLYGHPSKEVLEMLESKEIPYFRTDKAGCVALRIEKSGWTMDYYFS